MLFIVLLVSLPLDTSTAEYSIYSSVLNTNSATFSRYKHGASNDYYEALRINVTVSGLYRIWSSSAMSTDVSLYENAFDPVDPSQNRIGRNFYSCGDGRYRLHASLQKNTTYILVVTTLYENTTGTFLILTEGEAAVRFTLLVFPSVVYSSYSSKLDTSNAAYFHEVCGTQTHYYVALRMNVSISAHYGLTTNSSVEMNGYLYQHSFDPVNPCHNQISKAKFSWGFTFFPIQSFLQKDTVYILLVTTTAERVTNAFTLVSKGVAHLTFTDQGEFEIIWR